MYYYSFLLPSLKENLGTQRCMFGICKINYRKRSKGEKELKSTKITKVYAHTAHKLPNYYQICVKDDRKFTLNIGTQ